VLVDSTKKEEHIMINKTTLFGDVLNGKADVREFDGCTLEELNKMINSASSRKQRVVDAKKYQKVIELEARLKELKAGLTVKKTGMWNDADVETLDAETIVKAIKCAQSFKCMYSPAKQKVWRMIAKDRNDDRYEMAVRNLEIAPEKFKKALADEEYWQNIKDRRFPEGTTNKVVDAKSSKIQILIDEMSSRKKLSAADKIVLEQLKTLV
jgi:hypothetical protein